MNPSDLRPVTGPAWWPIAQLGQLGRNPRLRGISAWWLLAVALSIVTGILNVKLGWNGIEVQLAGMAFDLTIYPPAFLAVLAALWLGPTWAGVAIYLANLASAMTSGLSFPLSALFAIAGVIETLMLWGSLVTLGVDPDLRRPRDFGWFAAASLVAAATGSLAAILWNSSHGLDPVAGQRVWRGWVIGDLLQMVLLVAPVLRLLGPTCRSYVDCRFAVPPTREFSYSHGVGLVTLGFATLGAVVFLGVHQALASIEIALDTRTATGDLLLPRLREIVLVMGLLSTALIVATGMFSTALARMGERERREAVRDELTGCFNRRAFEDLYRKEAERSRRLARGIALLFVDLDRFKAVNDEHGHALGDLVLRMAAARIEGALRTSDLLFRWGGEEFVVVLPHTSAADAAMIAERVRQALEQRPLVEAAPGRLVSVTGSLGVASQEPPQDESRSLVHRADAACYEAKRAGRNRVQAAES